MTGILADINASGHVDYLVRKMQVDPWAEFWHALDLGLFHFDDIGLAFSADDLEVWRACQERQLVLITDNRNYDSPVSLEAVIRMHSRWDSLPVFTISDLDRFRADAVYVERVIESLHDYLLRIDEVRGVGRLYLP